MLDDQDWQFLKEQVLFGWVMVEEPVGTIGQYFGNTDYLATIVLHTGPPEDRTDRLVDRIKRDFQHGQLQFTRTLIEGLARTPTIRVDAARNAGLEAILAKVNGAGHANANPYEAMLLPGNRVFMDRTELRVGLRTLLQQPDKLVLRVSGTAPGTSYTRELILHLARSQGFRPVYVNLLDFPEPLEAMMFLAQALVANPPKPDHDPDDEDKAIKIFARWLLRTADGTEQNCWIILDECNHVQNEQPLMDMINRLAVEVRLHSRKTHRLLLLGHGGGLIDELRGFIVDNETRELTRSDVRQTLRRIADEMLTVHGEGLLQTTRANLDDHIDALVAAIWEQASANGVLNAADLSVAMEEVIHEHFVPV